MIKARKCFDVKPKNEEQKQAISFLTNPDIHLVILEGVAGSGKTFLALAAGLGQVVDYKTYKEIIFTRAPVGVGADMGFLPGDEHEKLAPWCGALQDNMEALVGNEDLTLTFIQSKIKIKAMQFMRGRSFQQKYIIIDEVQNMSLGEIKVLLTRAAEGTKIVAMGDVTQIDNKKLNKENNGLTALIKACLVNPSQHVKYVLLRESERSELCKWASEAL